MFPKLSFNDFSSKDGAFDARRSWFLSSSIFIFSNSSILACNSVFTNLLCGLIPRSISCSVDGSASLKCLLSSFFFKDFILIILACFSMDISGLDFISKRSSLSGKDEGPTSRFLSSSPIPPYFWKSVNIPSRTFISSFIKNASCLLFSRSSGSSGSSQFKNSSMFPKLSFNDFSSKDGAFDARRSWFLSSSIFIFSNSSILACNSVFTNLLCGLIPRSISCSVDEPVSP